MLAHITNKINGNTQFVQRFFLSILTAGIIQITTTGIAK